MSTLSPNSRQFLAAGTLGFELDHPGVGTRGANELEGPLQYPPLQLERTASPAAGQNAAAAPQRNSGPSNAPPPKPQGVGHCLLRECPVGLDSRAQPERGGRRSRAPRDSVPGALRQVAGEPPIEWRHGSAASANGLPTRLAEPVADHAGTTAVLEGRF
jgi:hypothetical protein